MKSNKSLLLISIGVISFSLLLLLANWHTARSYISRDGAYQLHFPLYFSLHVEEVKVQGHNYYHPVKNIIELDLPWKPKPYLLISFANNATEQSIDDYIENSSECDSVTEGRGEKIMLAGLNARIFRDVDCNSQGETRIYAMRGNIGYNFIFKGKPTDEWILRMITSNFSLL